MLARAARGLFCFCLKSTRRERVAFEPDDDDAPRSEGPVCDACVWMLVSALGWCVVLVCGACVCVCGPGVVVLASFGRSVSPIWSKPPPRWCGALLLELSGRSRPGVLGTEGTGVPETRALIFWICTSRMQQQCGEW